MGMTNQNNKTHGGMSIDKDKLRVSSEEKLMSEYSRVQEKDLKQYETTGKIETKLHKVVNEYKNIVVDRESNICMNCKLHYYELHGYERVDLETEEIINIVCNGTTIINGSRLKSKLNNYIVFINCTNTKVFKEP